MNKGQLYLGERYNTHTHHDPHLDITRHYWAFGDCGAVSPRVFRGRAADKNDLEIARFGRGSSEIEAARWRE